MKYARFATRRIEKTQDFVNNAVQKYTSHIILNQKGEKVHLELNSETRNLLQLKYVNQWPAV